ncbi:hypothetical protein OsI_20360 [Oryza sativa Indica Group]|uniref:Uncharacterized protein n=1 Tax=Oryza sativa subsp. indica TaxID=39946 RepID=B8AZA8_ORYSI|nr:hypothetical protein OsI_20360 [Oryza sativa Indica Group]
MEQPLYLQRLVQEDWRMTCRRNRFCFYCWLSFCDHCCKEHWDHHHPEEGLPRVATVELLAENPAMLARYPVGTEYDWEGIQRLRGDEQTNWILLRPWMPPMYGRKKDFSSCVDCHQRIKKPTNALYCCTMCKLNQVQEEDQGRDMVEALATGDYSTQALLHDNFCVLCTSSFSSDCCTYHMELHHPDVEDIGVWLVLIEVVYVDGWAAVAPSELVSENVLAGVQVLQVQADDETVLYPLRRTVAAAVDRLGHVPGWHGCGAPGCHEMIPAQALFCCLRCKAAVHWAA